MILEIKSRLILNSQGDKAVECTVILNDGRSGTFAPPAGTSIGKYEAKAIAPETALEQIKQVTPELLKINKVDQHVLDEFINEQEKIGANATLAISIAFAIAADTLGLNKRLSLQFIKGSAFYKPQLMVLFFEGGVHASGKVSFQEFMGIYDDIFIASEDYHLMREKLKGNGHFVNSGMEGALVGEKLSDEIIFKLMRGKKIGLDLGGSYRKDSHIDIMQIPAAYDVAAIEDHYPEDEIENWRKFYEKWHEHLLIVGDDLTVTNAERIKQFANNAINAVIIKPNQQRTLTDTLKAVQTARNEGLKIIVSHRSGETNQTFVSDLAVAIEADYVKFGAPVRGERVAKYNRLLYLTNS